MKSLHFAILLTAILASLTWLSSFSVHMGARSGSKVVKGEDHRRARDSVGATRSYDATGTKSSTTSRATTDATNQVKTSAAEGTGPSTINASEDEDPFAWFKANKDAPAHLAEIHLGLARSKALYNSQMKIYRIFEDQVVDAQEAIDRKGSMSWYEKVLERLLSDPSGGPVMPKLEDLRLCLAAVGPAAPPVRRPA